ncbi:uncharacterized protein F5147DRAFT_412861 [Suillus discolor]|uniref:F-box domain-containing protein n=1 Tax=Suillus discolor TaxID=1912936 RepID=A0A9P7FFS1_9AGAM|nr:uncharacterized protein F5147DRAFT_412861 [Suillus discolor]KAG2115208.1 hypothetical protein F5147DRAFT_412861 [Suillus discolor]
MHHWIPEIVRVIFEYIYDPIRNEEDIDGRVTVAGLARTCRAFNDPALDVLWAQLHSLDALVLCSGGTRDRWNQSTWDQPLYDADWRVLARHTRRVCTLTISPHSETWHISTMGLLNCFPLPGPLLPNLTKLNWLSNNEEYFPFLHRFCGPNLKTLRLSPDEWGVSKCVAVASLASSCPLLEGFLCPDADHFSMHAISEAVLGWNKLRLLQVGPVDEQALAHVASLQTLQELHFSAASDPRSSLLELCNPHALMVISIPTPSIFQIFMQNVHLSIQRLEIHCSLYDYSFPEHFFSHLQACLAHPEELTWLSLIVDKISPEDDSDELIVLNSHILHPLLTFKGLNHLDLGHSCTAHIDDTFLREIALSCPHLQRLRLGDQHHWFIAPLVTFDGIISLLRHCRQLFCLGIFFNATFKSNTTYVASVDAISPKITEFHVGASPIGDPVKVTAVLSFLFPSVTRINYSISNIFLMDPQGMRVDWATVNMWFETFVSARKESRQQGWLEGKAEV